MRNRNWVFGNKAGLSFNTAPAPFVAPPINTWEGSASISDPAGNLVLYSDGVNVWDASGTLRATGLQGSPVSTQGAVIIPDPANNDRYYILTTAGSTSGNIHFNGIRIDTATWTSVGISLTPMPPTAGYSPTEKLVAIKHSVKKEYWVLAAIQSNTAHTNDVGPGVIRVFRVTSAGISHFSDTPLNTPISDIGYMKASKGGRRLALANMYLNKVLVLAFHSGNGMVITSGMITIPVTVPPFNTGGFVYGVEFSPKANFLYYSTLFPLPTWVSPVSDGRVFQYKFPNGPSVLVGTHPNNIGPDHALGALQIADDGKIYIAQDGENKMGIITQPEVAGVGCGVTFNALTLAPGTMCRAGLPNMTRDLFII